MADAVDAREQGRAEPPFDGCALPYSRARYRMHARPCTCTAATARCQRRDRQPFAHQAMIEFTAFSLLCGECQELPVPTDSGNKHWVAAFVPDTRQR